MVHRTQIRTYPPFDASQARNGKFLQLEVDGMPWLLFASRDAFRYHNQLLAGFLEERGITHRWADRETLEYDVQRVRVRGGGRFRLDPDAATMEAWDNSAAYGRFDDERLQAELATASGLWPQLRIIVGPESA